MANHIWRCIGGMLVHYAQWGRAELMEKSLDWYFKVAEKAKLIAKRQGFDGLRWQKMTDNEGTESAVFCWSISYLAATAFYLYG
jgi:hypothetical protein